MHIVTVVKTDSFAGMIKTELHNHYACWSVLPNFTHAYSKKAKNNTYEEWNLQT